MSKTSTDYTVVIIGSGFGGSMTGLTLARAFANRKKGETILMLERGTWWTTPVGTVQDKEVKTAQFLKDNGQPVQYWSSVEHLKGFIDIFLRCIRRKRNEDGLFDLTYFGRRGFLGIGSRNDGVSILRASGVGGGSLIYANVTIQPPDFVLEDPRWPLGWTSEEKTKYFELARNAIGYGVVWAWDDFDSRNKPGSAPADNKLKINTGLSNIVTRSARLNPRWRERVDPGTGQRIKYIDLEKSNDLWIDRARVFQKTMDQLTKDYGTVDSSINDITPEPSPFDPGDKPKNYCERQGRCIVGCLPGARHTLNKQLMVAVLGKPDGSPPQFPFMTVEPLAEVDVIRSRPEGGYEIAYLQRDPADPSRTTVKRVTAGKVVIAAGCVGTNEILLRSKDRGTLPNLSDKVGFGFSTNGDYIAFVEGTTERVSLTRGPVTTSFGHFNTPEANPNQQVDTSKFHTIDDNGIPRAFSSLVGLGLPLLRSVGNARGPRSIIIWMLLRWLVKRLFHFVRAFFVDYRERQDVFESEDEVTAKMMCIAAMGREASVGQFRLGRGNGESPLRVARADGKAFHEDPIYDEIKSTLDKFAEKLTGSEERRFLNPFLTDAADALQSRSVTLSHPLGGCRMARGASEGVVDEYGRVFDKAKDQAGNKQPFHEGLYVADGAMIPTALGVNPSLTISALALRAAEQIIRDLEP